MAHLSEHANSAHHNAIALIVPHISAKIAKLLFVIIITFQHVLAADLIVYHVQVYRPAHLVNRHITFSTVIKILDPELVLCVQTIVVYVSIATLIYVRYAILNTICQKLIMLLIQENVMDAGTIVTLVQDQEIIIVILASVDTILIEIVLIQQMGNVSRAHPSTVMFVLRVIQIFALSAVRAIF